VLETGAYVFTDDERIGTDREIARYEFGFTTGF